MQTTQQQPSARASVADDSVPPAPGQVLKKKLMGNKRLTQRDVARALGVSEPRLTMMFKGRCAVTAEIALRVERAFNISPSYWMRARDEYELYQARQRFSKILDDLPMFEDSNEETASTWSEDELRVAA